MVFEYIGQKIIESALEIQTETLITIVCFLAGLMFYAKDFTLGLILTFFINFLLFIGFYLLKWSGWWLPLTVGLISLVIVSLSLWATNKKATLGGII